MSMKTWCLDPGHGGVINNVYRTAPRKMYQHSKTEIFYEGVWNRLIRDMLFAAGKEKGLHMIDLCPTELDVPLDERADIANIYYRQYPNLVGISLHSNAGKGTGFEVYTSPGQSRSDKFATLLYEQVQGRMPWINMRKDICDGDPDKESAFYILVHTKAPWILPEMLFYDRYEDYKMLIDPVFQKKYVDTLVNFMLKAELVL